MITSRQYRINISDMWIGKMGRKFFRKISIFHSPPRMTETKTTTDSISNLDSPLRRFIIPHFLCLLTCKHDKRSRIVYISSPAQCIIFYVHIREGSRWVNATWVYFSISSTHLLLSVFRVDGNRSLCVCYSYVHLCRSPPLTDFSSSSSTTQKHPHHLIT